MPSSPYMTKFTILENMCLFYLNLTLRGCLSLVNILKEVLMTLKKWTRKRVYP